MIDLTVDLDELQNIAENCSPGPWYANGCFVGMSDDRDNVFSGIGKDLTNHQAINNALLVSKLNPQAVMFLIADIRKMQSELELHRADYRAIRKFGFASPGEMLSAYKTDQQKKAGDPFVKHAIALRKAKYECTYWLYQNLMYDVKHIVKATWWRKILGKGRLFVAERKACSEKDAAIEFKKMGHELGYYSKYNK